MYAIMEANKSKICAVGTYTLKTQESQWFNLCPNVGKSRCLSVKESERILSYTTFCHFQTFSWLYEAHRLATQKFWCPWLISWGLNVVAYGLSPQLISLKILESGSEEGPEMLQ